MTRSLPAAVIFAIAWRMSVGREKLALLQVDDPVGSRRGFEQVGLPREERRNLQDVGDFGDRRGVRGLVDVGQDGDAGALAHAREDPQAFFEARAAEGSSRGAVGLVVRGLEDVGDADTARDVPDRDREVDRVGLALDDTGTRDEQQRTAAAHREPGKLESAARALTYHGRCRLRPRRARVDGGWLRRIRRTADVA